jgi:hypothetical protein
MLAQFLRMFPYQFRCAAIACRYDQSAAADRWTEQLKGAASSVGQFSFHGFRQSDGEPVKDLNDLLEDQYRELQEECKSD